MRTSLVFLLVALFVVPWGINLLSHDHASPFSLFPSVPATAAQDDSEPSRVSSTTPASVQASSPTQQTASVAASANTTAQPLEQRVPDIETTSPAVTAEPVAPTPRPELPAATTIVVPPPPAQRDVIATIEAEVLRLTNIERASQGLSALDANTKLRSIAVGHSADMLENDYFEHENLVGCSSSCRATNAGYRWQTIGENIYMMSGFTLSPENIAAKVVDGWMNSPGHRKNILGSAFVESGIGVASDGKSFYVTALYAKPR